MSTFTHLIIGGGVAGLVATRRLLELGARPCLLESGSYPARRLCGEVISGEAHPYLDSLNIKPRSLIRDVHFVLGQRRKEWRLPSPLYSLPREELELALLRGIEGSIRCHTPVKAIERGYCVELESGERVTAPNLLIGAGRACQLLQKGPPPTMRYYGLKAHLEGLTMDERLEMHLFKGGYYGLSPSGLNRANCALLSKEAEPVAAMRERFKEAEWIEARIPSFGLKRKSNLPGLFLIGDAAATIPPISGDGVAMAIIGAALAADFAARGDHDGYYNAYKARFQQRLRLATALHHLAIRPPFAGAALSLLTPSFLQFLYCHTRE